MPPLATTHYNWWNAEEAALFYMKSTVCLVCTKHRKRSDSPLQCVSKIASGHASLNEKRIHLFLLPCDVAFIDYLTYAPALTTELKVCTVQFLYLKTCGERKGGKKTNMDGAGYVINCFILFYFTWECK